MAVGQKSSEHIHTPFLLEDVLEGAWLAAGATSGITVDWQIPATLPGRFLGNPQRLEADLAAYLSRQEFGSKVAVAATKYELNFGGELTVPAVAWPAPREALGPRLVLIGEDREAAAFLSATARAWGFRHQWIPNPQACWENVEALVLENDTATVMLIGAAEDVELGEALSAAAASRDGSRLFVLGEIPGSSSGFIPRPLNRFALYLALSMAGLRPTVDVAQAAAPFQYLHIAAALPYLKGSLLESLRSTLAMGRNTLTLDGSFEEAIARDLQPACLLWPANVEGMRAVERLRRRENDKLLPRLPVFACELPGQEVSQRYRREAYLAAGFDGLLPFPFRLSDLVDTWDVLSIAPCAIAS